MVSSDVTFIVGREEEEIPARSFIDTIEHGLSILWELDSTISLKRRGTLRWVIGELSLRSPATVTLRAIPPAEGRDFSHEVARAYIEGMHQLETEGTAPPLFTDDALDAAGKLGRIQSFLGGRIKIKALDREVTVTERVSASVSELAAHTYTTKGSIEGALDMVTLHGRRYFRVYDAVSGVGVPCYFPPEELENVRAGLGRRVSVIGRARVNRQGDKLSLQVEKFRIFPPEKELPKPSDIRGLVPDMTEGRPSEDYVRDLWNDEQ